MKNKDEQQRILAVQRFRDGEKPESICASLGKSKAWLYKWLKRQEHHDNEEPWSKESSRRPKNCVNRTPYPALPSAGVNDTHQADLVGPCCLKGPIRFYVDELKNGSLVFENRHNTTRRYGKIGGKTPVKALASMKRTLRFPDPEAPPPDWRKEPEKGRYHFVRLIRSDLRLNIFGESFSVPPELEFEYAVATIDVKEQKLTISHDGKPVKQIEYKR